MRSPPETPTPTAPLCEATLERHFRRMLPDTAVVSLADLAGDIEVGCIDGRRPSCVAGAPGGSAGLLILLLASLEEETGRPLDSHAIGALFDRYLDHFGTFYLHSDRRAQDLLARSPDLPAAPPLDIDRWVKAPPPSIRPSLLEALLDPRHTGCGHLRLMLEEPEAYRVRRDLVASVLRGFFLRLWQGDPRLVFEVLDGDHQERGVVRIRTATPGSSRDAPVVAPCPAHGSLQLFVHHPDAVAWFFDRHAEFLVGEGIIPRAAAARVAAGQRELGSHHVEVTLGRLAPGLPVFEVRIEIGTRNLPADVTVGCPERTY
jgi:hypothetical protein